MRGLAGLVCLSLAAGPAAAQNVRQVAIQQIAPVLNAIVDFEGFDAGAEPGKEMSRLVSGAGGSVGAAFAGQRRTTNGIASSAGQHFEFDQAQGPALPLRLSGDGSFVIAWHRGFGSDAALPVGPDGAGRASGRGEGTLAVVFEDDQTALAFRLHADYPDPLGARPPAGTAQVSFFARDGAILETTIIPLHHGVMTLGFETVDTGIAGFTIGNTDPGGIAVDDIMFRRNMPTG